MTIDNPKPFPDPQQAALEWLVRLTSGEKTQKDQQEFEAWIKADPSHRQAYEEVQSIWKESGQLSYDTRTGHVTVSEPKRTSRRTRRSKARSSWRQPLLIGTFTLASSLLILWLSGWHWWVISDYSTSKQRQTIRLSGVVEITLDAQTAIDIHDLPGKTQVVLHKGAAWFKVTSPPDQHVVQVLTDRVSVTSLGTEFLVEKRPNHHFIAVTEHAVEIVSRTSKQQMINLEEGYGVTVEENSSLPWNEPEIASSNVGSWRQGRLVMEDASLKTVIERINDYHPGMLLITDNNLLYTKVSGVFDIDNPDNALTSLTLILPIKIERISPYLVLISKA